MKFYFSDGTDIGCYEDGKVSRTPCRFIENYKRNLESLARSKRWKNTGEGARFRGDETGRNDAVGIQGSIDGIYPLSDGYCYSANIDDSSAIYRKYDNVLGEESESKPSQNAFYDRKEWEEHIVNSNEKKFYDGMTDGANLICAMQYNDTVSDLAMFDLRSGDYKTLTEGDTLDEDPFICPEDGKIYFTSRSVGRNSRGEFVGYSPAALCKLDLRHLTVDELFVSQKFSYCKPVCVGGKLYAIRIPANAKKQGNPLLEIILIPFRILQALANLINLFVMAGTGKSLTSDGANPAKGREVDERKIYVKGNLIDVKKESQKNARLKDDDLGYVPHSWTLMDLTEDKELVHGVGDFDVCDDGTIVYTNGKRIFSYKDGVKTKLYNAEDCLRVSVSHANVDRKELDFFD